MGARISQSVSVSLAGGQESVVVVARARLERVEGERAQDTCQSPRARDESGCRRCTTHAGCAVMRVLDE